MAGIRILDLDGSLAPQADLFAPRGRRGCRPRSGADGSAWPAHSGRSSDSSDGSAIRYPTAWPASPSMVRATSTTSPSPS